METEAVIIQEPVLTKTHVEETHAGVKQDHSSMEVHKAREEILIKNDEVIVEEDKEEIKTVIEDPEIVTVHESESFKENTEAIKNSDNAGQISSEVTAEREKEEENTQRPEQTIQGEDIESKPSLELKEDVDQTSKDTEKHEQVLGRDIPKCETIEAETVDTSTVQDIEIVNNEETTAHESVQASDVAGDKEKEEDKTQEQEKMQESPRIQGEDIESKASLALKEEVDPTSKDTEEHEHVSEKDMTQFETLEAVAVDTSTVQETAVLKSFETNINETEAVHSVISGEEEGQETKIETETSQDLKVDKETEETEMVKTTIASDEVRSSDVQAETCGEHTEPYSSEIEDDSHGIKESIEVKSKDESTDKLVDVPSAESDKYEPETTQTMEEQRGLDSNETEAEQIDRNRTDETEERPVEKLVALPDLESVDHMKKQSLGSVSEETKEETVSVPRSIETEKNSGEERSLIDLNPMQEESLLPNDQERETKLEIEQIEKHEPITEEVKSDEVIEVSSASNSKEVEEQVADKINKSPETVETRSLLPLSLEEEEHETVTKKTEDEKVMEEEEPTVVHVDQTRDIVPEECSMVQTQPEEQVKEACFRDAAEEETVTNGESLHDVESTQRVLEAAKEEDHQGENAESAQAIKDSEDDEQISSEVAGDKEQEKMQESPRIIETQTKQGEDIESKASLALKKELDQTSKDTEEHEHVLGKDITQSDTLEAVAVDTSTVQETAILKSLETEVNETEAVHSVISGEEEVQETKEDTQTSLDLKDDKEKEETKQSFDEERSSDVQTEVFVKQTEPLISEIKDESQGREESIEVKSVKDRSSEDAEKYQDNEPVEDAGLDDTTSNQTLLDVEPVEEIQNPSLESPAELSEETRKPIDEKIEEVTLHQEGEEEGPNGLDTKDEMVSVPKSSDLEEKVEEEESDLQKDQIEKHETTKEDVPYDQQSLVEEKSDQVIQQLLSTLPSREPESETVSEAEKIEDTIVNEVADKIQRSNESSEIAEPHISLPSSSEEKDHGSVFETQRMEEQRCLDLNDLEAEKTDRNRTDKSANSSVKKLVLVEDAGLDETTHNQTLLDVESVEKMQKLSVESPPEQSVETRKHIDEKIEEKPKEEVTLHKEGQEEGSNELDTQEEMVSVPRSSELGDKFEEEELELQKDQIEKHEPTKEEEKVADKIQRSLESFEIAETHTTLPSSSEEQEQEHGLEAEPTGDMSKKGLEVDEEEIQTQSVTSPLTDHEDDNETLKRDEEITVGSDSLGTSKTSENVCTNQEELENLEGAPKLEEFKEHKSQSISENTEATKSTSDQTLPIEVVENNEEETKEEHKLQVHVDQILQDETSEEDQAPSLASGLNYQIPKQIHEEEVHKLQEEDILPIENFPNLEESKENKSPEITETTKAIEAVSDQTPKQVEKILEEETKEAHKFQEEAILPTENFPNLEESKEEMSQEITETTKAIEFVSDQTTKQVEEIHEEETKGAHKLQEEEILTTENVLNLDESKEDKSQDITETTKVIESVSDQIPKEVEEIHEEAHTLQVEEILPTKSVSKEAFTESPIPMLASMEDEPVNLQEDHSAGEVKDTKDTQEEQPISENTEEKAEEKNPIESEVKGTEQSGETISSERDIQEPETKVTKVEEEINKEELLNHEAPKLQDSKENKSQEITETTKAIESKSDQSLPIETSQADQTLSTELVSVKDDQTPLKMDQIHEEEEETKVEASGDQNPSLVSELYDQIPNQAKETHEEETKEAHKLQSEEIFPIETVPKESLSESPVSILASMEDEPVTLQEDHCAETEPKESDDQVEISTKITKVEDENTKKTDIEVSELTSGQHISNATENSCLKQEELKETEDQSPLKNDNLTEEEEHGDETSSTLPVVEILKGLHTTLETEREINDSATSGGNINIEPTEKVQKTGDTEVESNEKGSASDIIEALQHDESGESEKIQEVLSLKEKDKEEVKVQDVISREFEVSVKEKLLEEETKEIAEKQEAQQDASLQEEHPRDYEISKKVGDNSDQVMESEIPEDQTQTKNHETFKEEDQIIDVKEVKKSEEVQDEKLLGQKETFSSEVKKDHDLASPQVEKEEETHNMLENDEEINEVVTSEKQITDPKEEHVEPQAISDDTKTDKHKDFPTEQEEVSDDKSLTKEALEEKTQVPSSALLDDKDISVKKPSELIQPHQSPNQVEETSYEIKKEQVEASVTDKETTEQEQTSNDLTNVQEDNGTNVKLEALDDETRKREVENMKTELEDAIKQGVSIEEKNNMSEKIDQEESKKTDTLTAVKEDEETMFLQKETANTDKAIDKTQPENLEIQSLSSVSKTQDIAKQKEITDEVPKLENVKNVEELQQKDEESEPTVKEHARKLLSDLIQKVPGTNKTEDTTESHIEEEDDGDEHEHKDDKTSPDSIVMVEAKDTVNIIKTHKKSQGILSGVGSKVKHSISKVKKVLTGKSSHTTKPSSPN